jgi:hypothetical protein
MYPIHCIEEIGWNALREPLTDARVRRDLDRDCLSDARSTMKACSACQQPNPDTALFCQQCGTRLLDSAGDVASPASSQEQQWRAFIGPNADRYLEQFSKFSARGAPRFALTWHWPAFLFDPFLWFLYRKMYLYALLYAIGPVLSAYLTGDLAVGIVWRIVAGASANYVYFWHVKEQVGEIQRREAAQSLAWERLMADAGGVQPYVIWLGVALHALLAAMIIAMILQGPPESRLRSPGGVQSQRA